LVDRDTGWRLVFQGRADQLVDRVSLLAAGAAEAVVTAAEVAAAEVAAAEVVAACTSRWPGVGLALCHFS